MPVTVSYPGVYIEEIPSGVRTITGVATSITAFAGRVVRGTVNEPMLINSYADFERTFGGLSVDYPLSYAVRDFYLNGGSQAIIIGLFRDAAQDAAQEVSQAAQDSAADTPAGVAQAARTRADDFTDPPAAATAADAVASAAEAAAGAGGATVDSVKQAAADAAADTAMDSTAKLEGVDGLPLEAAYPGPWGNNLAVKVDRSGITDEVADRFGVDADTLFNLTVVENPPDGPQVRILNVSRHPDAGARRIDRALANELFLVRFPENQIPAPDDADAPADTPADEDPTLPDTTPTMFTGGARSMSLNPASYLGSQSLKTGNLCPR